MRRVLAVLSIAAIASGCVTSECDKIQPYQEARPVEPLSVPGDLSKPPQGSRAPAVTLDPPRREDGRCLEEPPVYVPPSSDVEEGST